MDEREKGLEVSREARRRLVNDLEVLNSAKNWEEGTAPAWMHWARASLEGQIRTLDEEILALEMPMRSEER